MIDWQAVANRRMTLLKRSLDVMYNKHDLPRHAHYEEMRNLKQDIEKEVDPNGRI